MSDKLIIRLSQSALGTSGCILNFYRTVIQGYKQTPSSKIVYGSAVHKYFDTMFKTDSDISKAVMAAKKIFGIIKESDDKKMYLSDERHMLGTCTRVWAEHIAEDNTFEVIKINDLPCSEFNFSLKYYEDDYIIVYLEGTLDNLGQIKGGCFAIRDFKTTSSWNTKDYFKRYELSRQLRFYTLICKLYAEKEPESTLGRIGATKMGAFIDAIFVKQDLSETEVKRSIVFQYSNQDLINFKITIDNFIQKLSNAVAQKYYYDKEGILNGTCEHKWGFCNYWNCCKAPDNVAELILKRDFKQVPFTPLDYEGGTE